MCVSLLLIVASYRFADVTCVIGELMSRQEEEFRDGEYYHGHSAYRD